MLRPQSDDPDRFVVGALFVTDETPERVLEVAQIRHHAEGLLLRFDQIRDRNAAEAMRGVTLTISAEERRGLDSDEFWPDDLEGLEVYDVAGTRLGTVGSVVAGAAQDRLVVVRDDATEVEVPFVRALVPTVDIAAGRIEMDPPPGLFD